MRNTYTRYHICLMRVFILLLSTRYNVRVCHNPVLYHYVTATAVTSHNVSPGIMSAWCVCSSYCCLTGTTCVCHNPVYHYITATAVYLTQRFITTCVDDISRMNSHCVYHVYCKSTGTRWKSGLRWNTYGVDKHHVCLVFCIACIRELPWDITMLMLTTIVNSLSQVADRPMSSPCWVDRAGPVLAYRTMHLNDVVSASSPMIYLDMKWLYSTQLFYFKKKKMSTTHLLYGYQCSVALLCNDFIKNWKTSAVSTTMWMVETQLCSRTSSPHRRQTSVPAPLSPSRFPYPRAAPRSPPVHTG